MVVFESLSLEEKQAFFGQLGTKLPSDLPTSLQERQEFLCTCTDEQLLERYYHKLSSIHSSRRHHKEQHSKELLQQQELASSQSDAQECDEYMKFLESL